MQNIVKRWQFRHRMNENDWCRTLVIFDQQECITMQLNLSGQHIEITDSLREHVSNKFAKLTRHFDHMTHVHVVLSVEKQRQKAEATIHVSGANLFASDEH